MVRIFGRKSRTRRTLGSHQIWVFCRCSEQLVGREGRREFKEASAHVLGAEASPKAALTIANHRSSHLTVARLRCRSPPIKVSIIEFPSSLWWMAEIRSWDNGSLDLIRAVDPEANGRCLMKVVDPWADAGGPGPRCHGHILWNCL
jgi:hypothetical protein